MNAIDVARPATPAAPPSAERSVDRASEGQDFEALLRSDDGQAPADEAAEAAPAAAPAQEPAIATSRPRVTLDSGVQTGVPVDAAAVPLASEAIAVPLPQDAVAMLADPAEASDDVPAPAPPPVETADGETASDAMPVATLTAVPQLLVQAALGSDAAIQGKSDSAVDADASVAPTSGSAKEVASAPAAPSSDSAPSDPASPAPTPLPDMSAAPVAPQPAGNTAHVAHQATASPFLLAPDAAASAGVVAGMMVPDAPPGTVSIDTLTRDMAVEVARNAAIGKEEFLLRLHPADHGTIVVRLQFQDDGPMRAVITADSPAVLDMLRRDSDMLASTLTDAGLRTDARSFQFSGGGHGGASGREPRQAFAAMRGVGQDGVSDDSLTETTSLYRPLRARAGVVNRLA